MHSQKESGAEVDEGGNITVKHKVSSEDGKCTFNLVCTGSAAEMSVVVLSGVQTGNASFEIYGTKGCKTAASVELRDGMLGKIEDYIVAKQLDDGELEIVEKIISEKGKSTLDISSDGVYIVLSGTSMDELVSNGVKNLKNSKIAFIIDNSGSMFSEEYLSNKVKSDEESGEGVIG